MNALQGEWHGIPKWVLLAGAGLFLIVLLRARSASAAAATGNTDIGPNQTAVDEAQLQADASVQTAQAQTQGGLLAALIAGITSISTSASQNQAAVQANAIQASAAEDIAALQASTLLDSTGNSSNPSAQTTQPINVTVNLSNPAASAPAAAATPSTDTSSSFPAPNFSGPGYSRPVAPTPGIFRNFPVLSRL